MPTDPTTPDPSSPERNPLGLGPRDRESSNTGSEADTRYAARDADPYTTGEPRRTFEDAAGTGDVSERPSAGRSTPADPDVPSSDEP